VIPAIPTKEMPMTLTEEDDGPNHNDTTSTTRRIAIVGAGFSGLTLANYLRRHELSYHLFESKSEPIPIIGKIRLPHATQVLQALGLQQQLLPEHEHDNSMVTREAFLNRLREHVTIHYSCCVVEVKEQESTTTNSNQQLHYYVMTSTPNGNNSSTETSTTTQYGPFDLVVAADGLFGNSIRFDTTTTAAGVVVIGDARWQFDTWWLDFGRQRIQRGGDIAICDAMELGQRLVDPGDWPVLDNAFSNKKRQSQQRRQTLLRMIMVPILLAILLSRIRMFEKI
jgi:hypothetical protein